jgi:hypothetical protein
VLVTSALRGGGDIRSRRLLLFDVGHRPVRRGAGQAQAACRARQLRSVAFECSA